MDGERSGSSAVCSGGGGVGGDITELEGGGEESCWMSPHPLVLVGVLEPQVVGQRSHGDGQLADLLQLNGPLVSTHDEGVHPPVGGLEEGREPNTLFVSMTTNWNWFSMFIFICFLPWTAG